MYNDVIIKTQSLGGCDLEATFDQAHNPKGVVLFSHNSHGSKEDVVLTNIQANLYNLHYTTLRYNFHFVAKKLAAENVKPDDLVEDLDSAYSFMLQKVVVPNVYLIGRSLGGVVSAKFAVENRLRCPVIILGFHLEAFQKMVDEPFFKSLKSKLFVIHGEKDEYNNSTDVRNYLSRLGLSFEVREIAGAAHNLLSADESIRASEDVLEEVVTDCIEFVTTN